MIKDGSNESEWQNKDEDNTELDLVLLEPHIEPPEDGHCSQDKGYEPDKTDLILLHDDVRIIH